jgi:phage/plasmid-associated DNA primase
MCSKIPALDSSITSTTISTIELEKKFFKIYSIDKYVGKTKKFINNNYTEYSLKDAKELLINNFNAHLRIQENNYYIFFGDCDYFKDDNPIIFFNLLISFLDECYNIQIKIKDISYTINKSKLGSYHYSIPKYYASCAKIKEIHTHFFNKYIDIFKYYDSNDKSHNVVDISIYKDSWFRYPNQTKESMLNTEHIIQNGKIQDFIIEYIPNKSICIESYKYLYEQPRIVKTNIKPKKEVSINNNLNIEYNIDNKEINNFNKEFNSKKEYRIISRFFDECFKKERFDIYDIWINIGMSLKNTFGDDGFILFDYYSSKGKKYDGSETTQIKYNSFTNMINSGFTIASIYKFAEEDNKEKYVDIIKKESLFKDFDLTSTGIANYIKYLKEKHFVWKDNELYCYNGKYWEKNDTIIKIYIGGELYDFLKNVLITCFWNDPLFASYKKHLDRLRGLAFKKEIIETTKEVLTNNKLEFDNKFNLFGFENLVYDLDICNFREYKYDDYISITTGYDWIEPSTKQIKLLNDILNKIFPNDGDKELYLTIASTGLEGRCLERFTIANGNGRNGKGVLNDLLLCAFGNYGLLGNSAILFETNKTGSNPEKNNMDKKRFIIFREPPEKSKFENSIVKELTGGGNFSARGHHETKTQKKLYGTIVVECNKKPIFAEEPTQADVLRLIDIKFGSSFVEDTELIDNSNHIYKGDKYYKTSEFQYEYRCAIISILFDIYKKYKNNGYKLNISDSVKQRIENYLQSSCNILLWITDNYEKTNKKTDIIKMKDIYSKFRGSEFYEFLSKNDKRKYNYTYILEYFKTNIFLKKYYVDGTKYIATHITNFIIKKIKK